MVPLVLLAVMTIPGVDARRRPQPAQDRAPVFSASAELVVVHVTVTDRRGAYVTDLPPEAFRIVEDGAPQRIEFFTGEDSLVTVGLLVDSSASMREGRDGVIAAATALAEASRAEDEIFGLAFNADRRALVVRTRDWVSQRRAVAGEMTPMEPARLDRFVRWIERGLVVLGSSCLLWVGATAMHAVTYQTGQNARLARLGAATDHLAVGRALDGVASRHEATLPIGRLEIPRIGLSAVVTEGDDEHTLRVAVGHLPDTPPVALTLITCYPFDFIGAAPPTVPGSCGTHRRDERGATTQ